MSKNLLLFVLFAFLSAAACAENSNTETTLKVDLKTVVRVGKVVPVGGVTTAGQPDAAALSIFAEQGYRTVIDIRTPPEDRDMDEAKVIGDLGMEYVAFPIDKRDGINFDNARELGRLIEEADGPVLVHCGSANRVGALFALRKSLEGAGDEIALEYGREAGMTRLEGKVKEVLGKQ